MALPNILRFLIFALGGLNQTDQVVASINALTDMSQAPEHPAQSLKFLDSAQLLCNKGGFSEFVSTISNMTNTTKSFLDQMTGKPAFEAGAVSQHVVDQISIACMDANSIAERS
jgi:hypothetical protein